MGAQPGKRQPLTVPADANEQLRATYAVVNLWRELAGDRTLEAIVAASVQDDWTGRGISKQSVSNYLSKLAPTWDLEILRKFVRALRPTAAQRIEIRRLVAVAKHGAAAARVAAEQLQRWKDAAKATGCDAWLMSEFTPQAAEVHTAVGRRQSSPAGGVDPADATSTPYIPRTHDQQLRGLIGRAATGDLHQVVLLQGTSSTGKTRSLYEAVQTLGAGCRVLVPAGPSALRQVHQRRVELLQEPVVLWLNEIQRFFGPPGTGLSIPLLNDLYAAADQLVVVGTLWPDKRPAPGSDELRESAAVLDEHRGRVHSIAVPTFTAAELKTVAALAPTDPRLQRALEDPDRVGFTQTLAGAGELLELYRTTEDTLTRDLLDAAGDARRLGHDQILPEPLLREMTLALWQHRNGNRQPPTTWQDALKKATEPQRGTHGVQALIPITNLTTTAAGWEVAGYDLADYLQQHLGSARQAQPVLDGEWNAFLTYPPNSPEAISALATNAATRLRSGWAEQLHLRAVDSGDPGALESRAQWLSGQPGREREAQHAWEAAASVTAYSLMGYAQWLSEQPDRAEDAESLWAEAVNTGALHIITNRAEWLGERPDRADDAERAWQEVAATGDPLLLLVRAQWLSSKQNRAEDTEAAWDEAVATQDSLVLVEYAKWLSEQPGRVKDADRAWGEAASADPLALMGRAVFLMEQEDPDRIKDVECAWQEAVATQHPAALFGQAVWLSLQPDRIEDAEQAWNEVVATGDPNYLVERAEWLDDQLAPTEEIENAWRVAVATRDPNALIARALWLSYQPDRVEEAECAWDAAVLTQHLEAIIGKAEWLSSMPNRARDAEIATRAAIVAGGTVHDLLFALLFALERPDEADYVGEVGLDAFGQNLLAELPRRAADDNTV